MSVSVRAAPRLSVVIAVGEIRQRAARCLASLFAQACIDQLEILLIDQAPPGTRPVPGSDHPSVRVIPSPVGTLYGVGRAIAVREARAPVVAFLEEHTYVNAEWAQLLITAHEGPWAGVGCSFGNANPGEGYSDVIALMSYGEYFSPHPRGESESVPGHNSSYKRDVLLAYGDQLAYLLSNDYLMVKMMKAEGRRFWIEPAAIVFHMHETSVFSISEGFYLFYRHHGWMRAKEYQWTWLRRLIYIVCAPIIPFYYISHALPRCWGKSTGYGLTMLRYLHVVYVSQLMGAIGQSIGLVFGPGDSEQRFTAFEMDSERGATVPEVAHSIAPQTSQETCPT